MITILTRATRPFVPVWAALAVILALGGGAMAESSRLTRTVVKQFVASYPAVKSVVARRATDRGSEIGSGKEALAAVAEAAADKDIKAEIDAATRPHGFRNAAEWFRVAQNVVTTYAYLKLDADDAKKQRKLEKAIARIRKNGLLSDKAKRKLIKALRQHAGVLALATPPRENVEAVRPMVAAIDAMVK